MSKYLEIKKICIEHSKLSGEVIDNKLVYYAAEKENLHTEFTKSLKKHAHITKDWPEAYLNFLMSELIAHRIFKKEGLIHKFLNHSFIKSLPTDQFEFLKKQAQHPWRFTFSTIVGQPSDEFFNMEDVFTEERYLLYSPGIAKSLMENYSEMWLLLVGFNGVCWQTFGLNIPLHSVHMDDIYFFATELDDSIELQEDISESINKNPIPFLLMLNISATPRIFHKNREIGYWFSHSDATDVSFETKKIKKYFTIEWNKGVYKLSTKDGTGMENLAVAYFDEEKKTISRYAFTEKGFRRLAKILNSVGFDLSDEAQNHLSFNMQLFMQTFFKSEKNIDPYLELFKKELDEDDEQLDTANEFIAAAIEIYNKKEPVDVEKIAQQVGLDVETANEIWNSVQNTIKKL